MIALDVLAVLAAHTAAVLLGHNLAWEVGDARALVLGGAIAAALYAAAAFYFGVNRGLRYYANFGDVMDVAKAAVCASLAHAWLTSAADVFLPPATRVMLPVLLIVAVAGFHALARGASHYLYVHLLGRGRRRTVVIVGVGDVAELVYQNMRSDEQVDYRIVAFYDDGGGKFGLRLHGVRVITRPAGLAALLRPVRIDEVVIAVEPQRRGPALDSVADALGGLEPRPAVLVAPTLEESLQAAGGGGRRKVKPADLLNRRTISLDAERIGASIRGKVVLISGAGGTIGSELARQAARYGPKRIILIENNATALFFSEADLKELFPEADVVPVLADVRDLTLLDRIFREERPQIVLHAAAHKHVHQLETNIWEAISNNLLGTYYLAVAADKAGAESFILISTDKAVRPKSVMGATKRAAEIVVSNLARNSRTRFAAVRFGNVLGSSGSVLKIFEAQLEKGQPLTITHPDATRYFMTVEEAVGLVLQASSMAQGGEIFVLEMGEQVRIQDMARRFIRLCGLEPDRDVPIRVVGLRPGEKIAEELLEDTAHQEESAHPEIMIVRPNGRDMEALQESILRLPLLNSSTEKDTMIGILAQFVPSFAANYRDHAQPPIPPSPNAASNN